MNLKQSLPVKNPLVAVSNRAKRLVTVASGDLVTFSNNSPSEFSNRKTTGFTLLELLVVIAIVGLMTAIVTVNANAARVQSRDAKRKADLGGVASALEMYYSEKSPRAYPATAIWDWSTNLKPAIYPTYISEWPKDPNGTDGTFGDGDGFNYVTNAVDKPTVGTKPNSLYVLDVALEGKEEPTNPDIVCNDSAQINFYLSGTFICPIDQKIHYRISPR